MIPIIAIANLINGLVSAFLLWRLYSRYKNRIATGLTATHGAEYFILLYLSLAIMWLLYAMPGLLITNLFLIMITQSIADVFVYIGSIIGIKISFFALNKKNVGTILSSIAGAFALFYIMGRAFSPFPHMMEIIYPYVYWHPNIPYWMQIMTGAVSATGSLIFVITFLILGYRSRLNKLVFRRSLFLSFGMSCLFIASLLFFIYADGSLISITLASIIGICGLLFMIEGVSFDEDI